MRLLHRFRRRKKFLCRGGILHDWEVGDLGPFFYVQRPGQPFFEYVKAEAQQGRDKYIFIKEHRVIPYNAPSYTLTELRP